MQQTAVTIERGNHMADVMTQERALDALNGQINGIPCVFLDPNKPATVDKIDLWKGDGRNGWQLGEDGRPRPVIIQYPIEDQTTATVEVVHKVPVAKGRTKELKMQRMAWEAKGFRPAMEAEGVVCRPAIVKWLIERSMKDLEETLKFQGASYNERKEQLAAHRKFLEAANPEVFATADDEKAPAKRQAARGEAR